jgi:hypothetical protein
MRIFFEFNTKNNIPKLNKDFYYVGNINMHAKFMHAMCRGERLAPLLAKFNYNSRFL